LGITLIDEDFSSAADTTPPPGWTQNTIFTNAAIDKWRFDNPGNRALNAPITNPAAIFDSDAYSGGPDVENVELVSPAFDASALTTVFLQWDQYFQSGFGGAIGVEVFNGTTWNIVYTESASSTPNPDKQIIDISSYVAGVSNAQVLFRWTGNYSWYWIVDNVVVGEPLFNEVALTSVYKSTDYYITPVTQIQPLTFGAEVTNYGLNTATNITVYIDADSSSFSDSISVDSIVSYNSYSFNTDSSFTPLPEIGSYTIDFWVTSDSVDEDSSNNVAQLSFEISDTVYSREDGSVSGTSGAGPGDYGTLGQVFEFYDTAVVSSVSFNINIVTPGDTGWVEIYNFTNKPDTIVASTAVINLDSGWHTLSITGGPLVLMPGTYFVAVNLHDNASISTTTFNFNTNTAWFKSPSLGINWTPTENLGFPATYHIRVNVHLFPLNAVIVDSADLSCNGLCEGWATAAITGGLQPYSLAWDDTSMQTTDTAKNLCAGSYTLTVIDAVNDTFFVPVTINEPSPLTAVMDSSSETSGGKNDGVASVLASGGTPPYFYLWNPGGATTDSIINLAPGTYSVIVTDANGCTLSDSTTIDAGPYAFDITINSSNVSCISSCDGWAAVSNANGVPPYSIQWNDPDMQTTDTAMNLCPGSYTVTVIDQASDTVYGSVTINEPAALIIDSVASVNANCGVSNGTLTVYTNDTSGTLMFSIDTGASYQASNFFDPLPAGFYWIMIIDSIGCESSAYGSINNSGAPIISVASSSDLSCNGDSSGSISITASGGSSPYEFSIDGINFGPDSVFSGLSAGIYPIIIEGTDTCISAISHTLTEPDLLTIGFRSADLNCYGDSSGYAVSIASGGTPDYSYNWAPGGAAIDSIAGLTPGTYVVILTDSNGCITTDSLMLSEPTVLTAALDSTNETSSGANDGTASVFASGGTQPYSYLWNPGGATIDSVINLAPRLYTVTVTDSNGCTYTDSTTVGASPAAIGNSIKAANKIHLYPNPTNGTINIELPQIEVINISVCNVLGECVREIGNISELAIINMDDMPGGTYFVSIQTSDEVFVKKIFLDR